MTSVKYRWRWSATVSDGMPCLAILLLKSPRALINPSSVAETDSGTTCSRLEMNLARAVKAPIGIPDIFSVFLSVSRAVPWVCLILPALLLDFDGLCEGLGQREAARRVVCFFKHTIRFRRGCQPGAIESMSCLYRGMHQRAVQAPCCIAPLWVARNQRDSVGNARRGGMKGCDGGESGRKYPWVCGLGGLDCCWVSQEGESQTRRSKTSPGTHAASIATNKREKLFQERTKATILNNTQS